MGEGEPVFVDGRGLSLAEALGIRQGEVVALVGGGGKTSAMFRLAAELAAQGGRVLVTTTTHIFAPEPEQCPSAILEPTLEGMCNALGRISRSHSVVVAARGLNPDGRLAGIEADWVGQLRDHLPFTNILVEADGSKGRPFKAPAAHEPVIPASADLVVAVVGLSVLGRPLSEQFVHRSERVATLAGVQLGDVVSADTVAAVVQHAEGSARGAPRGARIVSLLNQADDEQRLDAGRQVARELIQRGAQRAVIACLRGAGSLGEQDLANYVSTGEAGPVCEVASGASAGDPRARVSIIVLAAGLGRRMGRLKLGLLLGGKSLLRRVVEAALATRLDQVIVVLGHGAAELEAELPSDPRLRTVYNAAYAEGQSGSVKTGLNAVEAKAEAAIFLLGDQPLVKPQAIEALVAAFALTHAPVVQPVYRGTPGNPVLFARALFPELLQVTGDQGGREVLLRHRGESARVELDLDCPKDIDTAEDYEKLAETFPDCEKP